MPRAHARTAAVCLAAAITTLAGCRGKGESESAPVVTVDVAPVLLSDVQRTISADGLLYPAQQAAIVPKITAPIKKVYVERGDRVRAGQLLMELENRDLAGAADESRAAAELAEATYQTTARAALPQELQKAELDLQTAKDNLDAQQALFTGRQSLYKEGAIAQKDVNDAQVALTQARSQYEIARKHFDDLRGFATDTALRAAGAQRDQAKARNDAAQAQLAYSRITSPIDGVVTDRSLYAGETATPNAPVVTVMDLSRVIARAHISPAEAAELKVGNDARLMTEGAPVNGKVTQISPAADASNTTVEVWVQADNPDGKLKAGTSVTVEMIARKVADALVVPISAIMTSSSGSTFAIVVDAGNKPHLRKITVGIREKARAQVTDGLASGQRVATTGAYDLFKLDPDVLDKTTAQIAPAREEPEEPEEH